MATVGAILDRAQAFLRDRGRIWPRTELLRWLNDAYRQLLAQSQATRQFTVLLLPPRHTFALTYPWERRYTWQGTWRQWTLSGVTGSRQFTTAWEAEAAEGITPSQDYTAVTQLWEIAYASGQQNAPYRLALPRNHERLAGIWWDHKHLEPVSVRELDALEDSWHREQGEPWWWTPGLGESRSLEIYEIREQYEDGYTFVDWERLGMPRSLEGERTYEPEGVTATPGFTYTTQADAAFWEAGGSAVLSAPGQRLPQDTIGPTIGTAAWEAAYGATNFDAYALGLIRQAISPDRQYLPQASWEAPLGLQRDWRTSDQAGLLWEVIIPDVPDLTEEDTPVMVPLPMAKYLRYYVLATAYNRQGEGYRPDLSQHWQLRWQRGIHFLRRLGNTPHADVTYARQPASRIRRTVPLPQLPPEFPRVPWFG